MILRRLVLAGVAGLPWSGPTRPAPIADIEYQLTFNRATATARTVEVTTRFVAASAGPIALSLPAWTPGSYQLDNFARKLTGFGASQNGVALEWNKTDYDTWQVTAARPGPVEVRFIVSADTLDNAASWSKADFAFVNGTNVFLYPEAASFDFPATVSVTTESDWQVVTGMSGAGPRRYRASNYHDLVDMPFFIGRFDLDSTRIDGVWHRMASYPAGLFGGEPRRRLWHELEGAVPAMARVFNATPWPDYSTLLVFDTSFGGGSALEHQSSHLGIYHPGFIGTPLLASITVHEIFHAWNVKRLRPADLVPYRYDRPEPTPWLWVSEGITDYYADLGLVRGGAIDSTVFLNLTVEKIREVDQAPPVSLEDASLTTWIQPTDGTATLYYPKGSLAGFLLDIQIRDRSDNTASLDDVLRSLYRSTYQAGRGFTGDDWWAAVAAAAKRGGLTEFGRRYVRGREPFPWAEVVPLGGFRFVADTIREPRVGVATTSQPDREIVTAVVPGSAAAVAGIQPGDELLFLGDLKVGPEFGPGFRGRFRSRIGERIPVKVRRAGNELTLTMTVAADTRVEHRLLFDRQASPKAARIRSGILRGTTDRP